MSASVESPPFVSCVVIGRDEGLSLVRSIAAARVAIERLGAPGEVIYVDSASNDGSAARVRSLPGVLVVEVRDRSTNAAHARNVGIARARGVFVQLIDGDMELDEDWLVRAIPVLQSSGRAAIAGRLFERDLRATIWNRAFGLDWPRKPGPVPVLGGATLWRRNVLVELGGFDAALRLGEDPDLCLRARRLDHDFALIDARMAVHDLGLRSVRDYVGRARSVGTSLANLAWRHTDSRHARGRLSHLTRWVLAAACALAVAPLFWPWGAVAVVLAGLLVLARRYVCERREGLGPGDALVHALHVYVVKLPVAWGAFTRLYELRRREGPA